MWSVRTLDNPLGAKRRDSRFFAQGTAAVARKEFSDHLSGLRFGILLVLVGVTSLAAAYAASSAVRDAASSSTGADFAFLSLFTTSGESLPSVLSFIVFLAPLLGIALGFDAINSERSQGTLSRLISQPIHRDAVLQGKFLGGLGVISLALTALIVIISGIGIVLLGKPPSAAEIGRLVAFLAVTIIYVGFWLGLAQLFSVLLRQAATAALAAIAVWLFFAIFATLIVGLVVNAVAPANADSPPAQQLHHEQLSDELNKISPTTLYSDATTALLNPNVRTLGVLVYEQIDRAVVGPLSLSQSLILVWPQVISLLGVTLVFFTASYIVFMREEIRA